MNRFHRKYIDTNHDIPIDELYVKVLSVIYRHFGQKGMSSNPDTGNGCF